MSKLLKLPYSHILVLGLAKSGSSAAKLLLANGKEVRINDSSKDSSQTLIQELEEAGAEIILGSHPLSVLDEIDLVVKNPGIPYDNSIIKEAQNRGITIITEIELAGRLLKDQKQIIGITGSNGKTTTTTLITQMLTNSNKSAKIAGNIGTVATDIARELKKEEKLVLELSSFQLLGIDTFKPHIAVLLNVFKAHLDYHKTLENYQEAKFNLFRNQTEDDFLIYNLDDSVIINGINETKGQKIAFSLKEKHIDGGWSDGEYLYYKEEKIIRITDIVIVGEHNLENILAAICAAKISGATNKGIQTTLTIFTGVEHRLQLIAEKKERLFYNDSKATNILATQKALSAFKQPVILLAGGLDRGNEFEELIPNLKNVKGIVLFGQTANKIERAANAANVKQIVKVRDMNEAVKKGYQLSNKGDVILLSPACASWDQYKTFEDRGDMFTKAVHKLI